MKKTYCKLRAGDVLYSLDKNKWTFKVISNVIKGDVAHTTFVRREYDGNLTAKFTEKHIVGTRCNWDVASLLIYPQRKKEA